MVRSLRTSLAILAVLSLAAGWPGAAGAQVDYDGLEQSPAASNAARQGAASYPLLELDSDFRLIGARTTLWLTDETGRRKLGELTQGALASVSGTYSFRREAGGPVLATLDWKNLTLDPGGKIVFMTGDGRGLEIGRVRQRVFASVGTGLDVYRTGEKPIGYVDEKAGRHLENAFLPSIFTRKYYSFESIAYRDVVSQETTGFGRWKRQVERTRTHTDKTEIARFLGGELKTHGPSGVFTDAAGRPLLAVKGDWWLSKHIFDLVVRRVEAEGTAGAVVKGLGILLGGETDEQRRERIRRENEPVRNPSAYLGAFLAGLIYFPELRAAVGIELPQAR